MHKKDIISITGVSGGGKDYLLQKVYEQRPELGTDIRVINAGTELIKLLRQKGIIDTSTSRDELKDVIANSDIEVYVAEIISNLDPNKRYVFNGHIVTRSGNFLQVNPTIEQMISPRHYIVVEADPKDIEIWRAKDQTRQRAIQSPKEIEIEQKITTNIIASLAACYVSQFSIINNQATNISRNVRKLTNLITR